MQMGYLEGIHNAIDQSWCCPQEFYLADECPIFVGVLPRKCCCTKGKQLYGRVPYRLKNHTLHFAIGPRGYYKVWLSENNANDAEVKHVVLDNIPPPAYAPNLGSPPLPTVIPPHSFFIWDRLRQAGRCNNPSKQHYNPLIHEWFRQSKIQVVLLPPKGHEANPTELFQAIVQENVIKWQAPGRREVQIAVSEVLGCLRFNTAAFCGWYKARATGHHLQNRRKTNLFAKRVVRR